MRGDEGEGLRTRIGGGRTGRAGAGRGLGVGRCRGGGFGDAVVAGISVVDRGSRCCQDGEDGDEDGGETHRGGRAETEARGWGSRVARRRGVDATERERGR